MLIATFNINNVNRRLTNLLAWLKLRKPDIVCLQELKAEDRAFPAELLEKAGYGRGLEGTKGLEWRSHPGPGRNADPDARRAAGRPE